MPSKEFQQFLKELRAKPCDNPKRIGYQTLRRIQDERIPDGIQVEKGVAQETDELCGVAAEWLRPEGAPSKKVLFYIHGGGWSLGSIKGTRQFLAPMAKVIGLNTVHIDYRLMPEHPFPAGLNDCMNAFEGLLQKGILAQDIVLAGESAGANLALSMVLKRKDEKKPLPKALVLLSPVTYADTLDGSHTALTSLEPILAEDSFVLTEVVKLYAPGESPKNLYISPLYGDLKGLPPMLLMVGTDEILFDDTIRLYQKARLCGVPANLIVGDHMTHSWPIFIGTFPEAKKAVEEIGEYIHRVLN